MEQMFLHRCSTEHFHVSAASNLKEERQLHSANHQAKVIAHYTHETRGQENTLDPEGTTNLKPKGRSLRQQS